MDLQQFKLLRRIPHFKLVGSQKLTFQNYIQRTARSFTEGSVTIWINGSANYITQSSIIDQIPFAKANNLFDPNTFNVNSDIIVIRRDKDPGKTEIVCPYCGRKITVGQLSFIDGFPGCSDEPFKGGCFWYPQLGLKDTAEYYKETDYEEYLLGDWYRRGFNPDHYMTNY